MSRYKSGRAKEVRFRVYLGSDSLSLSSSSSSSSSKRVSVRARVMPSEIIFAFKGNSWGRARSSDYKLEPVSDGWYQIAISGKDIKHGESYGFLYGDKLLADPASTYLDDAARSVFWDFHDPSAYQPKHKQPQLLGSSLRILQTDLAGLIYHFPNKSGKYGNQYPSSDFYKFITDSGVIDRIKELGFNAVQFLPVAQSIDGDKWSFRYLVPYLFALHNKWGNPDDFARLVDAFHEQGIGIICDHVISHVPDRKFQLCGQADRQVGIQLWKNAKQPIYLADETPWGTSRYNFADPNIQRFVTESAIHFLRHYKVDGFRIDNVDGILRYGPNGDGTERPHGRETLRRLAENIYSYSPRTILNYEAHYFHGHNARWLVAPLSSHPKALGATAYNSSRLTYYLHSQLMPKSADDISPWKIKDIIDEKEWGKTNSTIADFHNHDAAAGLMAMRATGSYAYDALTLGNDGLHVHAVGKIKVMEALVSLGMEGRTLDLLQTFLLQTGSFEHDNSIHWHAQLVPAAAGVLRFKQAVNQLLDHAAFAPVNLKNRKYINLDERSKTLTIVRADDHDTFVIVINMSAFTTHDFVIPAPKRGKYNVILDSDSFDYSGTGLTNYPQQFSCEQVKLFEHFDYGLRLPVIAPYGVLVLQKN